MLTRQPSKVLHHLRTAVFPRDGVGMTDGQLLEGFLNQGDGAAFAALVQRHGPMVWGVCRRVLGRQHDAEDAFQATFLILVRKAASVRPREMVANWLYGVACRTAWKARGIAARRRERERQVKEMPEREENPPDLWCDLQPLLDEELSQLPDHYRTAIVLCDLEGKTRKEAAQQLGCPEGTVAGRLARARALLAKRLARRGVVLSAGLLAAALAQSAAMARVPPAVISSTIRATLLLAAGQAATGLISVKVAALTEGVLKTMLLNKLKLATAVLLLLVAVVAAGVYLGAGWAVAQDGPKLARADDRPKAAGPDAGGDGQQRRESTYSVRAVVRVMPPCNLKELNDDYQDVRVLAENKDFVELEVVVYPINSHAEAIKGNPNWKKDYAGMKEYLEPGITTNWDDGMRQDLLRELSADGIDPDKLTDKEVVEQVSRWLFKRSKFRDMFCTFYVGFRDGKPEVLPGLEEAFARDKGDPKWTVKEQLEHELFGREMFARKTYGTCTSTAVYQTTVLRALGIPTRMILCIPLADGSDPAQLEIVEKGLTNHRVRNIAYLGALSGGTAFASHTFCEVFVGGRWRRLNNTTLGQNILERNYLGLMLKVHTFNDLSEANLAATWGTRYAKGQRDEVFKHSNPYRLHEVSDHFGKFAKVPNPAAEELKQVTIGKAYWQESKDAPAEIRDLKWGKEPGSGRFFIHGEEWLDDAGDYLQYKLFMRRANTKFVLRAQGQADLACQITNNFYTQRSSNLCELEVIIPPDDYAKMASGVAYTLHPANGKKGYEWKVRDGLTITRP